MGLFKDIEDFITSKEMTENIELLFKRKNIDSTIFHVKPGFPDVANGIVVRCYLAVCDPNNSALREPLTVCICITTSEIADSRDNPYMSIKNLKAPDYKTAWAAKILAAIWHVYVDLILKQNITRPGKYYNLVYWFESQDMNRYWDEY